MITAEMWIWMLAAWFFGGLVLGWLFGKACQLGG